MMGRTLLWALEVGWIAAWALHFGAGWDVAVMPLAAIAAAQARPRQAWAVPVWILGAAAGALTGGWWGILIVVIAMWRGVSLPQRDPPAVYERVAITLVGLAPLAVVVPTWSWMLPVAVAIGLLAALDVARGAGVPWTVQLPVAGPLALLGAAAGLMVLALVALAVAALPLGLPLVRALFDDIGYLVAFLIARLRGGRAAKLIEKAYFPTAHALRAHLHHQPPTPVWLNAAAAVLAIGALWIAVRVLQRREGPRRRHPAREGPEGQVEREWVAPRGRRELGARVTLTRRVVRAHMRRAERGRRGPQPEETVREWLRRLYGTSAIAAAALYEEVRYGGAADDAARARALAQHLSIEPAVPAPPTDAPPSPNGASGSGS